MGGADEVFGADEVGGADDPAAGDTQAEPLWAGRVQMARDYLACARRWPPSESVYIRKHIRRLLRPVLMPRYALPPSSPTSSPTPSPEKPSQAPVGQQLESRGKVESLGQVDALEGASEAVEQSSAAMAGAVQTKMGKEGVLAIQQRQIPLRDRPRDSRMLYLGPACGVQSKEGHFIEYIDLWNILSRPFMEHVIQFDKLMDLVEWLRWARLQCLRRPPSRRSRPSQHRSRARLIMACTSWKHTDPYNGSVCLRLGHANGGYRR